jgi:hypothetical protein
MCTGIGAPEAEVEGGSEPLSVGMLAFRPLCSLNCRHPKSSPLAAVVHCDEAVAGTHPSIGEYP